EHYASIGMASNLIEMLAEDGPETGPFDANTVHIVVRDFHQLLEGKHARILALTRALNLLPANFTESLHEVNNGLSGKIGTVGKNPIDGEINFCRSGLLGNVR